CSAARPPDGWLGVRRDLTPSSSDATRQLLHGHSAAEEDQPRCFIRDASNTAGDLYLSVANAGIHDPEVAKEHAYIMTARVHRDHHGLTPRPLPCPTVDHEGRGKQEQEEGEREERRRDLNRRARLGDSRDRLRALDPT